MPTTPKPLTDDEVQSIASLCSRCLAEGEPVNTFRVEAVLSMALELQRHREVAREGRAALARVESLISPEGREGP